jgi:3-methyladenine DNA glycosylase AlkC
MSNLLKDIYSPSFYQQLCNSLEQTLTDFDRGQFISRIFSPDFASMELKQRMSHTIETIALYLPQQFDQAAGLICKLIENLKQAGVEEQSFEYMFLPEFIENRGLDEFETSVKALETITQYTSCEFAVRPFINRHGQEMIEQMTSWSHHENKWVRRLATEGSRPRLPWAMALPALKKDPLPLIPILENLKQDPSETVRRSVANNLNDISKDNPEFVLARVKIWQGQSTETDALIKHACRTLLKQGEPRVMALFGYDPKGIEISDLTLLTPEVEYGNQLRFSFHIFNNTKAARKTRIEYAIYHLKKNGELSPKVFKISEREIEAGEQIEIERKHSIRPITTRRYYAGRHQVAVIINGVESDRFDFNLKMQEP